jgi:hypothetical protein
VVTWVEIPFTKVRKRKMREYSKTSTKAFELRQRWIDRRAWWKVSNKWVIKNYSKFVTEE